MVESARAEPAFAYPRKRMGAGMLFVDERDRVLLVEPTYKPQWEIPGGIVEAGETPRAAAIREVREELGLDIEAGRLLVLDWVPPGPVPEDGLMLIYDGGALTEAQLAAITLPDAELRSWRWCDPAAAAQRLIPMMARRVAAAVAVRRSAGHALYLEDGFTVG